LRNLEALELHLVRGLELGHQALGIAGQDESGPLANQPYRCRIVDAIAECDAVVVCADVDDEPARTRVRLAKGQRRAAVMIACHRCLSGDQWNLLIDLGVFAVFERHRAECGRAVEFQPKR
jgi:hypothetical protein